MVYGGIRTKAINYKTENFRRISVDAAQMCERLNALCFRFDFI